MPVKQRHSEGEDSKKPKQIKDQPPTDSKTDKTPRSTTKLRIQDRSINRRTTTSPPTYDLRTVKLQEITRPKLPNGGGSPTIPVLLRLSGLFRGFSVIFHRGSPKTSPKPIYPHPLPDTQKILSLGKKSQFFGDGRESVQTITLTRKKTRKEKMKNEKPKKPHGNLVNS
jgi:hypothetical protein